MADIRFIPAQVARTVQPARIPTTLKALASLFPATIPASKVDSVPQAAATQLSKA